MSLYAYCKKASDGEKNSPCSTKCVSCRTHIEYVKGVWKGKGFTDKKY